MIKKKLAVAIAYALGLSLAQSTFAGSYDVTISADPTNSAITESSGTYDSTGENANLSAADIISSWDAGNGAVIRAITDDPATSEVGNININTDLKLDSANSAGSTLLLVSDNDININASIGLASNISPLDMMFVTSGTGVVNLYSSMGPMSTVSIIGDLVIGNTGSYTLSNASDSLTVNSITNNSSAGGFTYSAGRLHIANDGIEFNDTGLLGKDFVLGADHDLQAMSQTVGTLDPDSGSVIQNAGSNTVDNALTINAGGTYIMNGGSLTAGQINVDGTFTYVDGSVKLTDDDMTIADGGLLGSTLSIDAGEDFAAVNQTIGVDVDNVGAVTQVDGTNTVQQALTINEGSSYTQSGGQNTADTLNINAGGEYALNGGDLSVNTTNNSGTMSITGLLSVAATQVYNLLSGGALSSNRMDVDGVVNQQANSSNTVADKLNINTAGSYAQAGGSTSATTVNVNTGATYDLSGGSVTATDVNVSGTVSQSGAASVAASTINVEGGSYAITAGNVNTGAMNIGDNFVANSGSVTQTSGEAIIANDLTLINGGRYDMDGGNLSVGRVIGTGVFDYTDGGVRLTNDDLSIESNGLLGAAINIDAGDVFGSVNQAIGENNTNTGSVNQTGGENTVDQVLTINDGSSYNQSGGANSAGSLVVNSGGSYSQSGGSNSVTGAVNVNAGGSYDLVTGQTLSAGSLLVDSAATFSGSGSVIAAGDINDLRTAGTIDASYSGANINLAADIMNGSVNATESITLDSITVNGDVTGTAMTLTGDSVLNGAVSLKPYVLKNFYNNAVITSASGNNSIAGNIAITPLEVDRVLNVEIVDDASIDVVTDSLAITGDLNASQMNLDFNVSSGAALSVQGNTSSLKLVGNVATGGSLLIGNTTATNFTANGTGDYEINGVLATSGDIDNSSNVVIHDAALTVSGVNGAIQTAAGDAIIVGTDNRYTNTASLIIDNTVAANSNRIGDTTDIQLSTGSSLVINGHATDAVTEDAGSLIVNYLDHIYTLSSYRDFVSNVEMNAAGGSTQIRFDDLQLVQPANTKVNRIDFSTNGTFGGNERIYFDTAPVLIDGLLSNTTINGQEFVSYDNTVGIKSATTATNNFAPGGNVLITADTSLAANTAIHSLAVTTANITGPGAALDVNSGQLLLSGTSVINPAINLGAKQGQVLITGDSTLAGGVNGANGMFINGGGRLELAASGALSGEVVVNSGSLVLSADNAMQGADVTVYDSLSIGSTTQNLNSLELLDGISNLTGNGSIVAVSHIYDTRETGAVTVDASYQSTAGNVTVYADVMNGDVTAAGTAFIGRSGSYTYNYVDMNGNVTATDVEAYGNFDGDITATNNIRFSSSTVNGVISGTANVSGYATLYNANTYTGSTSGTFVLRGNGSIASSTDVSGSLYMYTNDGELNVNRIGDSAAINLNATSSVLNLIGSGSDQTGVSVYEDVGAINVADNHEVNINIDNSLNGTTTLHADSLNLGAGSLVFLSLGESSQLTFDAAPATVGSTAVIDGVYIEKDILGSLMPTWTTYGTTGVEEVVVAESSIASAAPGQFIRVTDAVNSDLASNKTIGAINVDTTQTMTGNGTLGIETGQMVFWKDNTIDIAQINFGAEQGFLANAGHNTINSIISGSNGLRKMGQGKITLGGNNTYTGVTLISDGEIELTGNITSDVDVANADSTLTVVGSAQLANIINNRGTVNLVNASYNNVAGNAVSGSSNNYGVFNIDATSSLTNAGQMYNQRVYNDGTVNNNNGGSISSVYNRVGASLSNYGNIHYLNNSGSATIGSTSRIGTVVNTSSFTNNGDIYDDISNSGTFINNRSLTMDGNYYSDRLYNTADGHFTNNESIAFNQGAYLDTNGTFVNNSGITFNNTDRTQRISGSFTNESAGTVSATGAEISLTGSYINKGTTTLVNSNMDIGPTGSFNNKGSVNIDVGSTVTGTGAYRQEGSNTATTVINGRVETSVDIIHGEISGSGYIAGDFYVSQAGTVRPGNSPGLLTIGGDFTLAQGADLIMEVVWDSATNSYLYDEIAVAGEFNALGNIKFDLGSGVDASIFGTTDPAVDPIFSLADFFMDEQGVSLGLAVLAESNVRLEDALGQIFVASFEVDELTGELVSSVSAVPVPAAIWLFGSGLLALAAAGRRRKLH